MTAPAALVLALQALPPFSAEPKPESTQSRDTRLVAVAEVEWEAAQHRPKAFGRLEWALIMSALAWHETRLAAYVQEGRCFEGPVGMRCDNGKARGPWQVHGWCTRLWDAEPGSREALKEGAMCASRHLAGAYYRCQQRAPSALQGAFSGYAGASCSQGWARKRERTALGLIGRWI